ncbi:hypothetical protein Gotri_007117 [Gossypium trilobum]|uniref:Uncharacterized protein n=3 Tax=Gossypium TaxID=3633 RepID=A0A7J9EGJ1_9ROSI|nr:hypothetical protein [Gossypium davidsonii]MBA0655164.1 hypothetical protein [Gossypium klotzschianum]MBA0771625.1 hypothetical protein [Gossypium trilobum]
MRIQREFSLLQFLIYKLVKEVLYII